MRSHHAFALAVFSISAGCGGDDETTASTPKEEGLSLLADPCDDALDSVYQPDAAALQAASHGDLLGCAYDRLVSADEMRALFEQESWVDPGVSGGAHKLRVLYATEREPGEMIATSGAVYLPEKRRGDPSPLLVLGHGSVGVADICAPSREDPEGFEKDWKGLAYTFAGDGWIAIQPDFPGLGTPGATTWMHSLDEGHAMLDATRAARQLFEAGALSSHNALVGHSNGAHAALSAQSQAQSYGLDGSLDAVVVYNPFWLSNAAWGALLTTMGNALINPVFMANTMMYFYGHLDAYEGPDHNLDAFLPDKADAIHTMLESGCWQVVTREAGGPPSLGIQIGADAYVQSYIDEVGACATGTCSGPLADTWKARWVTDRPPPDTAIPIVHWMGALDDFLVPGYQQCGIDRLVDQGGPIEVCVEAGSDHSGILSRSAAWVHGYLASVLLGNPAPAACPGVEVLPKAPSCQLPIPNSTDPSEP